MADIKLFKIGNQVEELKSSSATIEKELQKIIEDNMYEFFGVTFLKSEFKIDNGRMDSIGIDENNCPVIFEYKCHSNENVINQGLFYLNWLLNHKENFELFVLKKLGSEKSEEIDWSMPRVICIANDFNKYDEEAIKQINKNISLIRYKMFDNNLLMFELLNTITLNENKKIEKSQSDILESQQNQKGRPTEKTFLEQYESTQLKNMYDELKDYALSLGDDVSENILKYYSALKKIKNFATFEIYPQQILLNVKLNPDDYKSELDELKDIRKIGHRGCGDLQLKITDKTQLDRAKKLIQEAYNNN